MTNEQAIEWLIAIKEKYIHGGDEGFDERRKEALDIAIKSLKEERPQVDDKSYELGRLIAILVDNGTIKREQAVWILRGKEE